jgi:putative transposase
MKYAFKYRIYPNSSQKEELARTFGSCRFLYNKALDCKISKYQKENISVSYNELATSFLLSLKQEFPWLKQPPSQALQQSLKHLDSAYQRFFKLKIGFPKFKSKYSKQSFSLPQGVKVDFVNNSIILPKIGRIKAKLHRTFEGNIKTCTISKTTTGKYYISILIEHEKQIPEFVFGKSIGIDLGIKTFATLSTGEKVDNPKYYHKYLNKLQNLQKKLSLKIKGSNNYKKIKLLISGLHEKISQLRENFLHQLSYRIVNENQVIILENLDVKELMEKSYRVMSRNFGDSSLGTFISYIRYKCERYGKKLLQIGKYDPSSKKCSCCGKINKELELKDREWKCSECGTFHDRDMNAAKNILQFGMEQPEFKALQANVMRNYSSSLIGSPCL